MLDLCMSCMGPLKNEEYICPQCGEQRNAENDKPFMHRGKIVGDRYIIGKGIKQDPEGLGYIGYDFVKKSKVYIREFFPSELAKRDENGNVLPSSYKYLEEKFNQFMQDFLKYFRSIARLRNLSSLVAVYDILEQYGTSYIIMQWVDGERFDKYLSENGGFLDWKSARILFMPLLSSLIKMESAGVKHLGISPCNMIVTDENKIKLVGFATKNLRTNNEIIKSELFEGTSALEQYNSTAIVSESTDVYGFTASLFYALTGEYPLSALERKKKDRLMMPSNIMKNLPETVVSALANALRVYSNSRTISFESLRVELSNSPVLQVKNIYQEDDENFDLPSAHENDGSNKKLAIISCVVSLAVLIVCLGVYWMWIKEKNAENKSINDDISPSSSSILNQEVENSQEETKIDVPQLVGKKASDVQNSGSSENLYSIVILSEEFHNSIPEGCIISQTPAYGEKMYEGSVIAVNISKGPQKRTLPSITGKTLSEASLILTDAKFKPTQVPVNNSDFSQGTVIGYQDYKAGDLVDYGSEIFILVSKG